MTLTDPLLELLGEEEDAPANEAGIPAEQVDELLSSYEDSGNYGNIEIQGVDGEFDVALFEKELAQEQEALSELEQVIVKAEQKSPAQAFDTALANHQKKLDDEAINAAALDAFDAESAETEEEETAYGDGSEEVGDVDIGVDVPPNRHLRPRRKSIHQLEMDAVEQTLAERELASIPEVQARKKPIKWRAWQIDFGASFAPAGSIVTIENRPQVLFKAEKIMATDTGSPAGTATRVLSVTIGQKVQKAEAFGKGTLTQLFSASALENGISFDTAKEWSTIAVTVSFVQTATFDMSLFGSAVVD